MQPRQEDLQITEPTLPVPWYALYTKHQHEKAARDYLARKGFEVLLPLYRATHRWKDRKKILHLPVFPCYLFIRGDLDRKVEILKTPGVFWFVESGGRACEIPDSDVDGVRKIVESSAHVEPHRFLKSGEYVRISRGPLAGVQGILTRVKNNIRVVLSVHALLRGIAVEVDLSMVEPVSGTPQQIARAVAT
jgi:transcription antitermination factor NusG